MINKPSGVTVNRAETTKSEITVEDWLPASALPRRGIVHRLDKDTSGLLIVAKTPAALDRLQQQFKLRQVKKTYLALVHGRLEPAEGRISLPVARNPARRRRFGVFIGGRQAVSQYRVIRRFPDFTLTEVYPRTGRTHQIRVHFRHLNHSLAGDPLYLGKKRLQADRRWCPRLFLHACGLSFSHPGDGRTISLESPLPDDLQAALDQIPA